MQGLNPCAVRTKRFFVSSFEDKERGNQAVSSLFMVEVTGLEPAASCSQSKRATNCATPRFLLHIISKNPDVVKRFPRIFALLRGGQGNSPENRKKGGTFVSLSLYKSQNSCYNNTL